MSLRGGQELRRRLRAIGQTFKPVGREWADETVRLARQRVTVRSGRTRGSIRRRNASQRKAAVEARGGARFLEAGTKPHEIKARKFDVMKFQAGGMPMFRKKVHHRGMQAKPFLHRSAREALDEREMLEHLIDLWNRAA